MKNINGVEVNPCLTCDLCSVVEMGHRGNNRYYCHLNPIAAEIDGAETYYCSHYRRAQFCEKCGKICGEYSFITTEKDYKCYMCGYGVEGWSEGYPEPTMQSTSSPTGPRDDIDIATNSR